MSAEQAAAAERDRWDMVALERETWPPRRRPDAERSAQLLRCRELVLALDGVTFDKATLRDRAAALNGENR